LKGVHAALNVEKGMELLKSKINPEDEQQIQEDDDSDSPE
jgi:rsbT antagonist protein RsbS